MKAMTGDEDAGKYTPSDLKLGDTVAWEKDGVVHAERVQSVHYSSAEPAIWPRLSFWQRAVRWLTPQRWRKPLQPIRPYKPATMELGFGDDPIGRHLHTLDSINKLIGGFRR